MERPTDLPQRNVKLLQVTMNKIEKYPETHNQSSWVNDCGTAFCYAGHAAIIAGAAIPDMHTSTARYGWWCVDPETLMSSSVLSVDLTGDHVQVDEFATKQLGITFDEGEVLFAGDRTIRELRLLVDALCTGAWIEDEYIYVNGEREYIDEWLEESD